MMYMYLSADNPHIRYVKSLLCALVKIITKLINIVLSVLHAVWYPCGALSPSLCTPHVISHGSQTVT